MSDVIIRIDLAKQTTSVFPPEDSWAGLGGRGLTSAIIAKEVPPTCHPLGPSNKLVFAPGLLSGTRAANSGRLSAGAKSPLTGTIKESNAGGTAAKLFARLNIKALIIEGIPDNNQWLGIHVSTSGVEIQPADDLAGAGNYELMTSLSAKHGDKKGVISIGPAGEMRMPSANISVKDPGGKIRSCGRGGLGAVMGSKKIKYILIDDDNAPGVSIADTSAFNEAAKTFAKALTSHPVSGEGLPTYGTNVLLNVLNEAGGLPTRNFSSGEFDAHDKISGEAMHDIIVARGGKPRHGCHEGCVIQCSQVYKDKNGNYVTGGFEYETIWGFGANCCIDNLDQLAEADHIMDDIGIDSIETAVAIGVAMEAGVLAFGDGDETIRIIRDEIANGTPLGRIIGGGAELVGKTYGITRVPVVKSQGIPAYDPRAVKGIGITYATSTMGADHTAGYAVATNILNVGGSLDPLEKAGQVELSRNLQIATAAIDTTGLCLFVAFPVLDIPEALDAIVAMINAKFGIALTGDDVTELGKNVLKTEHAFNIEAGFTAQHDRLPEFFHLESVPPHNVTWDFSGEEIDAFWNF